MVNDADWTKEELVSNIVSKMTAVTVPVNIRLEGRQRVLDLSEVKKLLGGARVISLGKCGCREKVKKCDAPLDVCICLDKEAEDMIKKGLGMKVSLGEALAALQRSHEAGLVHIAYTFNESEKPDIVCSCCHCCCHSMSALVRFGIPEAVVASKYVSVNNAEACTNCGTCVNRCQFKARRVEEGKLAYDSARCFGCGVCVSTCPTKSISLEKRA
jgi:Pyruvate/2-oxoacid:ferredoxin oxidoreductase delta subunit